MSDIDWRRLPPLSTLRAFEATARLGGYSAAARALNVTPAAIAQQVRKLEAELGAPLVRRDGRGLALTDAGNDLAQPLGEAFRLIARGIEALGTREASRGVTVSTTDFFANAVILPAIGDLWRRHPKLKVSFSPDGNTAPVDLESFDIVIRGSAPGHVWEGCRQIDLLETPMILTAAPKLLKEKGHDLSRLPWIRDRSIGGTVWDEAVKAAGCDPDRLQIVDPGSAKLELEAALMGYGVHFTPELTVRTELSEGSLVRIGPDIGLSGVYSALVPHGRLPRPATRFLDWLEELCATLAAAD